MHIKTLLLAALVAGASVGAQASTNLVVNGGFETTTNGPAQFDNDTVALGWTSNGYNFIFGAGTADTTGSYTGWFNGYLTLWGPNNGSANGLTASSPTGGNFVGADGAFATAPITQTINGLTVGKTYTLGFDWAAAQQAGFSGATTENWTASLGNQSFTTATFNNANHGFSGWIHQTFTFTASNSSELLSFLAHGTPDGLPPFSLLDGVTLTAAVPEPASWALMVGGFAMIGAAARRRRLVVAA